MLRAWADNTRAVEPREFVDALVDFAFDVEGHVFDADEVEVVEVLDGFKERQTDRNGYATTAREMLACLEYEDRSRLGRMLLSDLEKASDLLTPESKLRRREVARQKGYLAWRPGRVPPPHLSDTDEDDSGEDD